MIEDSITSNLILIYIILISQMSVEDIDTFRAHEH